MCNNSMKHLQYQVKIFTSKIKFTKKCKLCKEPLQSIILNVTFSALQALNLATIFDDKPISVLEKSTNYINKTSN